MSAEVCRRCGAALPLKTDACPLCGVVDPRSSDLSYGERQFSQNNPEIPSEFSEYTSMIEANQSLVSNLGEGVRHLLNNPDIAPLIWGAVASAILGIGAWVFVPAIWVSFFLFFPALLFLAVQFALMMRAVFFVHRYKRLRRTRSLAPYSVHFRMERQIRELLGGLHTLVRSVLDRDWRSSGTELNSSAESFMTAARVIVDRLRACATPSLEMTRIIWQNNVYAILASEMNPQEKAAAIGAKCREGEALLLRYRWLITLPALLAEMEQHIQTSRQVGGSDPIKTSEVLDRYHLQPFGPMEEGVRETFDRTPADLLFTGRQYWIHRLPPMALEEDESYGSSTAAKAFFKSLKLVRPMRHSLEEQMALNTAAMALSTVSPLEGGIPASAEARAISREGQLSHLVNIPEFKPDAGRLNTEVDRLVAEARVAMGTDRMAERTDDTPESSEVPSPRQRLRE